MYLIDKPFVSNFLIETIRANSYPVVATPNAQELINDETLNWISESNAIQAIKDNPFLPVYSNSENALSWLEQHLGKTKRVNQIKSLKDKVQFREQISHLFPDFDFKKIELEAIQTIPTSSLSFPFVIKPSIGFFSIGVHIIHNEEDWQNAQSALTPEKLKSIFPENVLNTSHFIIEAYIEGEEYAIDYYYDENGKVVVLNIMHHLFASGTDTSDRVYTTSKDIFDTYQLAIQDFLGKVGQQFNLTNFPAHAEIRIDKTGRIVPIEINPLRFGGWCTTADVMGITLGLNPYQAFFEKAKPNWDIIFKEKENKLFSLVLLDNSSEIAPSNIAAFDYEKLLNDFEKPIHLRKLDIRQYPVFGFVFTETDRQNKKELYNILSSDLKKYLTLVK